jgi:hypothetical protein
MAATPMMSMAAAEAALNAILALLDNGFINIYTGSIPATAETSPSGTALSTALAFSATAFAAATDGGSGLATASANSIASDTSAANSGTAGYFRALKSDHTTVVLQGTCGTSSADMILSSTSITAGQTIAITSYIVNLPDGSGAD